MGRGAGQKDRDRTQLHSTGYAAEGTDRARVLMVNKWGVPVPLLQLAFLSANITTKSEFWNGSSEPSIP